jgi:hypothetical protein
MQTVYMFGTDCDRTSSNNATLDLALCVCCVYYFMQISPQSPVPTNGHGALTNGGGHDAQNISPSGNNPSSA